MALLTKRVLEASVDLYGVADYAASGAEHRPMSAVVQITRHDNDVGGMLDPLGLLVPLCASRLLSLSRREPSIVAPTMDVVRRAADALGERDEQSAQNFRVRDVAEEANAITLALPIVETVPPGSAERSTKLVLARRRSGGKLWGEFKMPAKSGNPVVTSSALFAALEYVARFGSYDRAVRPTAIGLAALVAAWTESGSPPGVSVAASAEMDTWIMSAILDSYLEGSEAAPASAGKEPGQLDTETWISETSIVATREFEPAAESALQTGAIAVVGIESAEELSGDALSAVISNARFGYALRNWECGQLFGTRPEPSDDELAPVLDLLDASFPESQRSMWIASPVSEIVLEDAHGGLDAMLDSIEGVSGDQRREAIAAWGDYWPTEDRFTGRTATERLVAFGYLLHHAYDLRPHLLDVPAGQS